MRHALLLFGLLALCACKDKPAPVATRPAPVARPAPPPSDPLELRRFLLAEIPGAMEQTVCACCNKPLGQCFRETLSGQGQRCPDT
jgi:hypothetical protein